MDQRIDVLELEPQAYRAMTGLEQYLKGTDLSLKLRELIKIRASQINGCAYCIEMHTKEAKKAGESEQRMYALSAWWESPLFDEEERVALAMTDEITKITERGLTKETYQKAEKLFSSNAIAQIIMQIGVINIWNRIAVATHKRYPED